MTSHNQLLKIDVGEVLTSKNPRLAKYIPNFVIGLLKRIIHQDEINEILGNYGQQSGIEFVNSALKHMNITYNANGLDRLEKEGRYIFASNHPLGGLDGLVLMSAIGGALGEVKFVVNDLLMHIEPLKELFVPVNKHGRQNQNNALLIDDAYSSDAHILYFPAGLCSRLQKGKICDTPWKKSFVNQAIKYKRDIVPVYFEGINSKLFYKIANFRKWSGIKFNYEMLLLPHEMFRQKNATFGLRIGDPIPYEKLEDGGAKKWTELIREKVYSLKP